MPQIWELIWDIFLLSSFLIQRSHGNPFYCEELLRNLHLNNVLQFHVVEEEEETEDEWDNLFSKLWAISCPHNIVSCTAVITNF